MNKANAADLGNGLLGLGHIGVGAMARVRAKAFLERRDVRIVVGWSRSQESLEGYRKLTGAHGTCTWRRVIEDPNVDAICVGTPTNTHAQFALAAIEAGKHVLVECPAAGDMADLDGMAQAAERSNVVLYIGSNYRFDRAAQAIAYGTTNLGDVRLVQGDSSWQPHASSWFWDRALSGGVFPCVHLYQLALFHCLGQAQWIEATFGGEPSYGVAKVRYENGAIGIVTGGFHKHGTNQFLVIGSEGMMRQEPDGHFVLQRGAEIESIAIDNVNPTGEDNACFLGCIHGEDDWRTHLARERAILGTAIAAQQSAETDERVRI